MERYAIHRPYIYQYSEIQPNQKGQVFIEPVPLTFSAPTRGRVHRFFGSHLSVEYTAFSVPTYGRVHRFWERYRPTLLYTYTVFMSRKTPYCFFVVNDYFIFSAIFSNSDFSKIADTVMVTFLSPNTTVPV